MPVRMPALPGQGGDQGCVHLPERQHLTTAPLREGLRRFLCGKRG